MNVKANYKKGYKGEIIRQLYKNGIIPYRSLPMLAGDLRMYKRSLTDMQKANIVVVDKSGGEKNVRFADRKTKKEYVDSVSKEYERYYTEEIQKRIWKINEYQNEPTKTKVRTQKLIHDGATKIFMYACGIKTTPDIASIDEGIDLRDKTYYGSYEVKSAGGNTNKNQTSRINGVLFSPGGVYPIYNIGKKLIEWKRYDEIKMITTINNMVRNKSNGDIRAGDRKECIVMATDLKQYVRMIDLDYNKKNNYIDRLINIDESYKKMYAVPEDRNGKLLLEIMTEENWSDRIYRSMLTTAEREGAKGSSIYDGYDVKRGIYSMVFCVPDLVKLKKFVSKANIEGDSSKFRIYMFDFQIPIVVNLFNEKTVTIKQTKLEIYRQKYF